MPVQQHVLNWLYSVLTSEYHDVNRTYNDVAHALARFPSLAPRTDVHTFTSGSSALLVHLAGTLPVTFRGSTYRFPVSVWMPHAYPEQGPLIYVTPTDTMSIRPGQHVDPQGQVYHPYLVNWASNPQASSLVGFLDILAEVFGREPPVVARQAVRPDAGPPYSATAQPPDESFVRARPPPPPPKMAQPAPSDRSSLSISETRGPPLPQLPSTSTDEARNLSRYDSAPPLPRDAQSPMASGTRLLSNRQSYDMQDARRLSNHAGYNPQGGLSSGGTAVLPPQIHGRHPGPSQHPGLGQPPHMISQAQQQFPPSHTWHVPEQRPTQQLRSQASEHPPLQRPPRAPADLMDEPLELSIPDSSSVAPPPIPPNPEKDALLRQLAHTLAALRQHSRQQNDSSLSGLQAQRKAMLAVLPTMENEMNQLTHLSSVLSSNASILRESLRKADGVIEGSRSHPTPSIDELLVAPTVVANQLYTLVAEERALGDAIFMLGRAVERGRVSPAVFAKMTRSLAREWYLKKALVRKIGLGMGLAP